MRPHRGVSMLAAVVTPAGVSTRAARAVDSQAQQWSQPPHAGSVCGRPVARERHVRGPLCLAPDRPHGRGADRQVSHTNRHLK